MSSVRKGGGCVVTLRLWIESPELCQYLWEDAQTENNHIFVLCLISLAVMTGGLRGVGGLTGSKNHSDISIKKHPCSTSPAVCDPV